MKHPWWSKLGESHIVIGPMLLDPNVNYDGRKFGAQFSIVGSFINKNRWMYDFLVRAWLFLNNSGVDRSTTMRTQILTVLWGFAEVYLVYLLLMWRNGFITVAATSEKLGNIREMSAGEMHSWEFLLEWRCGSEKTSAYSFWLVLK